MPRTKTKTSKLAKEIKDVAKEEPEQPKEQKYIPTGCTLLNLALTDEYDGGWPLGRMANIIGDSSSGKSILGLTMFAEMCQYKKFDSYDFIYDDVEAANQFNMDYLFGHYASTKILAPFYDDDKEEDINSNNMEDFEDHVLSMIEFRNPFAYVLDSFDALGSDQEDKKADERRIARRKGKEAKGTYGMEKAKLAGIILRNVVAPLEQTDSFLAIISQTRDNIDPMSFQKKTRSGGKALKFYATHELWLAGGKKIKKKDKVIGIWCHVKITKNKLTGKVREIKFPIYYDYGIDDITANIEFLCDEKVWSKPKTGQVINTGKFAGKTTKSKLIKLIEEKEKQEQLAKLVGKTWNTIEESLRLNRKSKYE